MENKLSETLDSEKKMHKHMDEMKSEVTEIKSGLTG
jgi:hypothetical protein